MEDFVRKTRGVRDITSLPLDTSHELDIVSDVKGKIYIKILNRYKELLFDNGTEPWVTEMLNKLEVDVEQLKEDVLDLEQALTELPMIEDKLETVEKKLAQINTLFAQMQIDVQGLDLRTAELEREVVQLALKDQELLDKINNLDLNVDLDILYSNSNEFGDYDYSGRPNLIPNLDFSKFSGDRTLMRDPLACFKDHGTYLELDSSDPSATNTSRNIYVPKCTALIPNNTYIMTVPMMINEDFDNFGTSFIVKANDGTALGTVNPPRENVGTWQNVKKVFTVPSNLKFDTTYLQLYQPKEGNGKIYIGYNIKIEKVTSTSDTATPYQPNLLVDPYYLGKSPLGENIANPTITFPINASTFNLYIGDTKEALMIGQTYTITLKGTKPASQTFAAFNRWDVKLGELKPVEGLTDVWSLTFTPTELVTEFPKNFRIYQLPEATAGACQIDWLKIEKGDTRTPNIPYYKYVGINLEALKNPNDYEWIPLAKSAETVDSRLTKTISTYDTVNALQNNRLTALESKVVDTTWQNVTVTEPFTSVTQPQVKKQNGIVYMRGTISNGTGDCFTLPEGFRPPAGAYEMQFRLPCRSALATDYATIYVRPSGLCSIAGVNGTTPIFLSGIIFSTT